MEGPQTINWSYQHKLSSTDPHAGNATINGYDFYIGSRFKGKILEKIRNNSVTFRDPKTKDTYIIKFRKRK